MSTITKRQIYWRDHVLAAAAFDGTIVEYAALHNLKTKDIYQWKSALTKRGFLPMAESRRQRLTLSPFIPVDQSALVSNLMTLPSGSMPINSALWFSA